MKVLKVRLCYIIGAIPSHNNQGGYGIILSAFMNQSIHSPEALKL
jgi:hypothetical protein